MPYRTVNYLAYRVSVATSAARGFARDARTAARENPSPEIEAHVAMAEAAAERAEAALNRCNARGHESSTGPVIRVKDRRRFAWDDDEPTRAFVGECYSVAQAAREEAQRECAIIQGRDKPGEGSSA